MERILTEFEFFYNSPLVDFYNTIHFLSNFSRDDFFDNVNWKKLTFSSSFNFEKSKGEVLIPCNFKDFKNLQGINYARLKNDNENVWYYYFIPKIEYINQNVTKMYLIIDVLMTYTQGNRLLHLDCLNIEREHLTTEEYNYNLEYLQKNDDIMQTFTKKYIFENGLYFNDFKVLIHSSADLTSEFGDINSPKLSASTGGVIDNIYSPLSVYCVPVKSFTTFTTRLSQYAWIAQHIKKIVILPSLFINENDLIKVETKFGFNDLYKLKDTNYKNDELKEKLKTFSISYDELIKILNVKENLHLLRNEYFTVEVYNYNGENMTIDISDVEPKKGISFDYVSVIGYENIVSFFVNSLKKRNVKVNYSKTITSRPDYEGHFLNNAITFSDFDNVPILIDNQQLSISKTANQRALQQSRLFSGRVNNIINGNDSTSKVYDAISLVSNISFANLFGRLNDEYNYYKDMKANQEDMKLDTPTVTSSTNKNALVKNNGVYGLTLKISAPCKKEMENVINYYKTMGYKVDKKISTLSDINSMTCFNYVKFTGSYYFENVDTAHNEILKAVFAEGVRLWHYNEREDGNDFKFSYSKVLRNERVI